MMTRGTMSKTVQLAKADKRIAELEMLRSALEKIRDEEGRVCEEYEICTHRACSSSYRSWAIADQVLKGQEE